ncbi:transcriptional regulator ADR1 [Podospora fimiseda]|uniref:Transcriptional regulator ADR1 n=1 Tax=Podospora fimiseda TaxID=252190 RepID=A0AAN7BVB0_9PEZI|nr:transcriptional regulator ADR1 [Podospora fimiseda]
MLPMQSIEAPPGSAQENGEARQQKPKTLPCKFCSKRFRRVEHVQRHERTHTKEKPFACTWDRCGKTFGRRDLLVRHEKLVHLNDGNNKDGNASRPRKPSMAGGTMLGALGPPDNQVDTKVIGSQHHPPPSHYQSEPMQNPVVSLPPASLLTNMTTRAPACSLDMLSDAATQLASGGEVNNLQTASMPGLSQQQANMAPAKVYHDGMSYGDRGGRDHDIVMMNTNYTTQPQAPPAFDTDYSFLLDDYQSSHFFPPSLEAEHGYSMWNRIEMGRGPSKPSSAFPSRFPSVQPDARDPSEGQPRPHEDGTRPTNRMISQADHDTLKSRFDEFSSVTPSDFVFPSRHTLHRFLDGYISCFHESLPFLHLPTLTLTEISPELLLAIMCVGAQYRFEPNRSHGLWYAAKAVAMEQIRRRHSHEVHGLLPTIAAYSPHSTRPSPSSGFRHSFPSIHHDRPMTQETHREPYSPNTPQSRLETIQALLLLFAVGLWGAKAILHEALSLQSLLALLLREEGLVAEANQPTGDWEAWIRFEGATRTKLVAYCFFNLCSITYNTPPQLLTSEIHLLMPNPSRLWRAETAWQWQEARQAYPFVEVTFQDAFSRLLGRQPQSSPLPLTSLGHYVLIHALIQRIYMLKETISPFHTHGGLKLEDVFIEELTQALKEWKTTFERHLESKPEYQTSEVTFNSGALIRLAYIRLYTDLSTKRSLETRDRDVIAQAFNDQPLLVRTPLLCRAVMQAIHALSMLVKMGVNFVAKAKSQEWSMQHCLCNLECAVLLSKWLLTLSAIGPADPPPSAEENNLFTMVRRMLDETEFAVPVNHIDPSLAGASSNNHGAHQQSQAIDLSSTSPAKLRQLACAVVRLWAATFTGEHRFEITKVMNAGLEGYGNLIEKPRDRTPLGRIVSNQGLG